MSVQSNAKPTRVLIFPTGSQSALDIYYSLRYRPDVEVFGLTANHDFSEFLYDPEHFMLDKYYIFDDDFDERFDELLRELDIDVVIPTLESILEYLAEHRDAYSAKVLVSDAATAHMCFHKRLIYEAIAGEDFCPITYDDPEAIPDEAYPVFAKQDVSSASIGAFLAHDRDELMGGIGDKDYVVCEYLPGEELTIDCFTNSKGELVFVGARRTERMRMGLPFRSTIVETPAEVIKIAHLLNDRFGFLGSWFVDLKQDASGRYKVLEVNCRQAGTLTLYRHMGINFANLGIHAALGEDLPFSMNEVTCQVERCVHNAFRLDASYAAAVIETDALVVKGEVCLPVMEFAYQCVNDAIPLTLRASQEEREILENNRISLNLFDNITNNAEDNFDLNHASEACVYVSASDEKRAQAHDLGYLVFDPSTIDALFKE